MNYKQLSLLPVKSIYNISLKNNFREVFNFKIQCYCIEKLRISHLLEMSPWIYIGILLLVKSIFNIFSYFKDFGGEEVAKLHSSG